MSEPRTTGVSQRMIRLSEDESDERWVFVSIAIPLSMSCF